MNIHGRGTDSSTWMAPSARDSQYGFQDTYGLDKSDRLFGFPHIMGNEHGSNSIGAGHYIQDVNQPIRRELSQKYHYPMMEAIRQGAERMIHFHEDIDNSEEEDLSDEELMGRIKERKAKERALRSHIGIVKQAAQDTI